MSSAELLMQIETFYLIDLLLKISSQDGVVAKFIWFVNISVQQDDTIWVYSATNLIWLA